MQGAWPYMTILEQTSTETLKKTTPNIYTVVQWTPHRSRSKETIWLVRQAGSHPGSVWGQLSAGIWELLSNPRGSCPAGLSESQGKWQRACVKKKDLRSFFLSSPQQSPADCDVCSCTPGVSVFFPLSAPQNKLLFTWYVSPHKPARVETFSGFHVHIWNLLASDKFSKPKTYFNPWLPNTRLECIHCHSGKTVGLIKDWSSSMELPASCSGLFCGKEASQNSRIAVLVSNCLPIGFS